MIYLFHVKRYLLDVDCVSWFTMCGKMLIGTCALYVYCLFYYDIWPATLINSDLVCREVYYCPLEYTIRY
jgi:hypothetical protein